MLDPSAEIRLRYARMAYGHLYKTERSQYDNDKTFTSPYDAAGFHELMAGRCFEDDPRACRPLPFITLALPADQRSLIGCAARMCTT